MGLLLRRIYTNFQKWAIVPAGAVLLWVAYLVSTKNYLLFHSVAELFTIIISFTIALIVFHNYQNLKNDFIPIIGIAYAFAGIFDMVHTLAYKGLGVFPGVGPNLATQTWIIARYLDSAGMLVAGLSFDKTVKPRYVLIAYSIISIAALLAVFSWQVFPVCFVEGQGLTPFKIYSEYIISLMLIASIFLLVRHKNHFYPQVYRLLLIFFVASIGTEFMFTLYRHVYGWKNFAGHMLKIGAFFFLYRAIVETSLKEPFNLLFFQINQANRELKSFANIIAHDFRAPLVNLQGFAREIEHAMTDVKRIIQDSAGSIPEKRQGEINTLLEKDVPEALRFIYTSVGKMDRMITALLKLSRLGRRELHYEVINMNELVKAVLQSFHHQVEEKNIQVEVGLLPHIKSDRLALEQIISNLLDNAIKYLEPGRRGQIGVCCIHTGDEVTFCVRDNGRGIAAGDQEKIFEIFQRAGKQDAPGDGMGLAYVKALIRHLGGRVSCNSEVGLGTKVYFTL